MRPRRCRWIVWAVVVLSVLILTVVVGLPFILRARRGRALEAARWMFGRVLNPAYLWAIDQFRLDESIVYHTGRKSGREYATPLCVSETAEGFILPAAFGSKTDWFRNLRAASEARLLHKGTMYRVKPEIIDAAEALRSAGGEPGCPCWQSLRVEDFARLRPIAEDLVQSA